MILDSSDLQLSHGSKQMCRKISCHEQWPVGHRWYNYPACSGGGLYYASTLVNLPGLLWSIMRPRLPLLDRFPGLIYMASTVQPPATGYTAHARLIPYALGIM